MTGRILHLLWNRPVPLTCYTYFSRQSSTSWKRYKSSVREDTSHLFEAAKNGDVNIIQEIDCNIVDIKDNNGWTCMMHACKNGHLPVVQQLLKSGSKLPIKNSTGQTAKELASFWRQNHIVNFLDENEPTSIHSKSRDYGCSVFFTQNPLIRHSEIRGNENWLYSVIQKLDTKFMLMYKSQPVVIHDDKRSTSRKTIMKLLQCSILETHEMLLPEGQNLIFLGMFPKENNSSINTDTVHSQENELPMFVIDISHIDFKEIRKFENQILTP